MQTQLNLEAAVRLDPGSADCHMRLARAYQYDVRNVHPERALEHLQRATRLSPHDPQAWIDLAATLEYQGEMAEAEVCLRRADILAPNIPAFQWPIANFYLLQGKTDEAFRHLKMVLAGTSQYDQIVFSTAWKASGDPNKILDQLIPRKTATEFSYLYYLLLQQRFSEAQSVWKRIISSPEKFPAQQSWYYIDTLIGARRPQEAYHAWKDLQSKGVIRSTVSGTPDNMLDNGDFEDELLNIGFDWRIVPVEGVYVGLDPTTFHSPSHALLVEFSGKQNIAYQNVVQYALLEPGRSYRLQGFVKTENITTDSGPRLRVYDAYDAAALDQLTERHGHHQRLDISSAGF